jgi:hypothetical protein
MQATSTAFTQISHYPPPYIFFPFFDLINTFSMERMKKANTFRRFTLFGTKRKKFSKTACGLVLAFYSWNIPLFVK